MTRDVLLMLISQSKLGECVKYIYPLYHYPNVNSYKQQSMILLMLVSQSKLGEGEKYTPP